MRSFVRIAFTKLFPSLLLQFHILTGTAGSNLSASPEAFPPYVPGEVILKLKPDSGSRLASDPNPEWALLGSPDLERLAEENRFLPPEPVFRTLRAPSLSPDGRSLTADKWLNVILKNHPGRHRPKQAPLPDIENIYLVRMGGQAKTVLEICRELENLPKVVYAEPNYLLKADASPNDPDYSLMWSLNNTGQSGGTPGADLDAPEAWDIQKGSRNIVIGVIDSGMDYLHPDLLGNLWVNEGEMGEDAGGNNKSCNGVDDDGNGFIDDVIGWNIRNHNNDPMDDYYHGTAVSGILAAVGNEGSGIPGINWTARIMPLKSLGSTGSGSTFDAIRAVEYAILMGADILNNSYGGGGYNQSFKEAIEAAYAAGIIFVAAAGNDGEDNDLNPHYPSSYDVANIVAVAATDHDDNRAIWNTTQSSNWGAYSVDLAGPGKDNYTTSPGNAYRYFGGTSSASPHVAGVAALIWAQDPSLTVDEVKSILQSLPNIDLIPDFDRLGPTPIWTGGRVNARKCIEAVAGGQTLGEVAGEVTDASTGSGLPGARILLSETGQLARSDAGGLYSITAPAGNCTLAVSAYCFSPQTAAISIPGSGSINHDFSLGAAPTGALSGSVRDAATGEGLEAALSIFWEGTKVEEVSPVLPSGDYAATLPPGMYAIHIQPVSNLYRGRIRFGIVVNGGETTTLNFELVKIAFKDITWSMGLGLVISNIDAVVWLDYDNDDWPDLYLGADASSTYSNRLFRNESGTHFDDVTSSAGAGDVGRTKDTIAADFDNDGDPDIFVANMGQNVTLGAPNRLFINNGGTFSEEAGWHGLTDLGSTLSAAFGDYNSDALLDLVVGNANQMDYLYKGSPGGSFTSANQEASFSDYTDPSGMTWADYDDDGDQDLFVGQQYEAPNHLLRNDGGFFTDVSSGSGLDVNANVRGAAWADYDNDSDLDLYLAVWGDNYLFRNDGGVFTDVTSSGTASGEQQYSAAWADYDNDSDLDLAVCEYWGHKSALFENLGDGSFRNATLTAGIDETGYGKDVAWADFDRDGDLDLYIGKTLWENLWGNQNNWFQVRLRGIQSNRDGIGARIIITAGGVTQMREVNGNEGSERIAHFGLGQATGVDQLTVSWPSGVVDHFSSRPANQTWEIQEGLPLPPTPTPTPVLTPTPVPTPTPPPVYPLCKLEYSTYLGGSGNEYGAAIAIDSENRAHVTGVTYSNDFPTVNSYQSCRPGIFSDDIFVSRLSASGSYLIYSTYLGGGDEDIVFGICLDSENRAYLTGYTISTDFPTQNPYQASLASPPGEGYSDVFVSQLSSSGSALIYSTYLGGYSEEEAKDICLNSENQAYVTGLTYSTDFPTQNPYQPSRTGNADAFVSRLSASGSSLLYSTYLGGGGGTEGYGICLDSENRAYVTGLTYSDDFPTVNPYQSGRIGGIGFSNVFVTQFSSSGSSLLYSTYLGGEDDWGYDICLDSGNRACVTGSAHSDDFPTVNPYQSSRAGYADAFVSRLSSSGSILLYSTYVGGGSNDDGYGICLDSANRAYITGWTQSDDFPTANPYQSGRAEGGGNPNVFVTQLSPSGSYLIYSTYIGGVGSDYGNGISVDSENRAYVTGRAGSEDFPTKNPYQAGRSGNSDAFVGRLVLVETSPTPVPSATPSPTRTPSPSPTATPAPTPTPTATPAPTPTTPATPTLTPTPTVTPTTTPSPPPSVTPTPTCGPTVPPNQTFVESGDYDGDGTSDIAIFRKSSSLWAIRNVTRAYFGTGDDRPVSGDYQGDGSADLTIFRPSAGLWAIRGVSRIYFGGSGDIPSPGDYDGNGITDVGIFRESGGFWAIRNVTRAYFGMEGDRPVSGDFTGNGMREIAIFRPTTSLWAIRNVSRIYFGGSDDWSLAGDYDGDGTWDVAIFRASSGLWALRDITRIYYGCCPDWPVPADYNGDFTLDLGIFRQTTGLWAVRGISRVYYGASGDLPVTR